MTLPAQCACTPRGAIVPWSVPQLGSRAHLFTCMSWVPAAGRAIRCNAEAPWAPDQLSNVPVERTARRGKKSKSFKIQPQFVQLRRKSNSGFQKGNGKYKQARDRLTVALLEADVDTAIDAVSEARALASVECLPSTPSPSSKQNTSSSTGMLQAGAGQLLSRPRTTGVSQPAVSAIDAFDNRERSTAVARQLSLAFGGLHARFIRMCLRSNKPQAAFNYVVLLPTSEKMHGSLMHEISKHGSKDLVAAALDLRELFQLPMDKFTLCAALSKLATDAPAHEVQTLYEHHRDNMSAPLDTFVFNAVLSAHASAGDTAGFESVWSDMRAAGCSPTAASHACRVKLLSAAEGINAVLKFYHELVGTPDNTSQRFRAAQLVSPQMYTSIFAAVAAGTKLGGSITFPRLWDMWRDMIQLGLSVDDQLVSSFLAAAKEMDLKPREVETCFGLLATLRSNRIKPGVGVLCNLLQVCSRNDTSARVLDIWALVEADRLRVTPYMLSAALACCARCVQESQEISRLALRLEIQLRERWVDATLWQRFPGNETNFRVAFNALLAYHAAAGRFDHGVATWQFMKESGPTPNHESYCAMLHVCGSTGNAAHAQRLLADMHSWGLNPDIRAFCGVLDACAKAQDVNRAWEVLESMPSHGVSPNVVAYTCIMDACVREGTDESLAQVPGIMETLHEAGMRPSAVTYGCALAACEASRDADQAFKLYHEACEAGVRPTDHLHNALIKVCVSAGNLDDALEQIKSLIRAHGNMQQHTINSLTRALSDQYIDRALVMLRFMRRARITPNHKTYHALIAGCARESMPDVGLSLYVEMRTCGHLPASRSGSPLIAALSQAGRLEAALLVLRDMAHCADGLGSAVAAELSALVEQPEDGRIYGAKRSGQDAESRQLQNLAKSLPQLVLSYRLEGEEDILMSDNTDAGDNTNAQASSQHGAQTPWHRTHTATVDSSKTSPTVGVDSRSTLSGPEQNRHWRWAGTAVADSLDVQHSEQSIDQVHQTLRVPERPDVSTSTRGRKRAQQKKQKRKRHALRKSDMLPTIDAVATIVLASVIASEELVAAQLYEQLRRQGSAALSGLLQHGSRVFELLIEGFCRGGRVHDALSIFDDWKAARDLVVQQRLHSNKLGNDGAEGPASVKGGQWRVPKLSNVTLAYLEASCHACSDQEDVQWRVYDVCALMRQQQEEKKTRKLLRPRKGSHHVREEW